jgi:tRNA (guanine10-N2)-dimethyltransferase
LARDEVIVLVKSYDKKARIKIYPRLVLVRSKVWREIAKRATFVKYSGIITGKFHDISDIDVRLPRPKSFVCRTINLSSKKISSDLERQAGKILHEKWYSKVSLSSPALIVYLIITDTTKYIGYAQDKIMPNFPKKAINYPHQLDEKLAKCMINLSGAKKGDTICDPFCGTGTILLQANSMRIKSIGIDFEPLMCNITRKNLAANQFRSKVINSSYNEIQKIKGTIDSIVTDLPYGIASRSSVSPKKLQGFCFYNTKEKKACNGIKKGLDVEEMSKAKKYEIYRHKSLTRFIAVR